MSSVYSAKIESIASCRDELIPGPWCRGCTLDCIYAKKDKDHIINLDKEFSQQLPNWERSISDAVEIVVRGIKGLSLVSPVQTEDLILREVKT